ncbi:hypothetical protein [Rhizobium rosettiformans]|uniref:hypothetical protein n=1 Tax=Rhizobium rosettiformans TaxID=1368430 RepID=UPI0028599192|nr:hypothetical protein [Rhizobium rosettiformans]MDR7029830.1 hypothetical protein [Rhizobium rosettiformans]MDR7063544.1 hypothetical protein [Rhizobium rosettiformans]
MPTPDSIALLLWEVALESARMSLDQQLPSRLDCVFASPDVAAARRFRDAYRPGGIIYETDIVGSPAIFVGDSALISNGIPAHPYADIMSARARQYWLTTTPEEPELVVAGSLQVLAAVHD